MATDLTITLSHEQIISAWETQTSYKRWLESYKEVSQAYGTWDVDIEMLSYMIDYVQEGFINKHTSDKYPENLIPLLKKAIEKEFQQEVLKNSKWNEEEGVDPSELRARDYCAELDIQLPNYDTVFTAFYDGYLEGQRSVINPPKPDLSEVSAEELLEEIKNRV